MATEFERALADFQTWANSVNPDFGNMVGGVIQRTYVSQLGDTTQTPEQNTVDKLGSLINSIGDTYLKGVTAYYTAQQKIADLKALSKGSPLTQVAQTAQGAIAIPPSNMLLIGGLGVLGLVLLLRSR